VAGHGRGRGGVRGDIGAYDKRFPWEQWERAGYRPDRLGGDGDRPLFAS
jgi:hypothetical protein